VAAALVSFLVGSLALSTLVVSQKTARDAFALDQISQAPWWAYIGGFLGACYVTVIIIAAPTLGMGLIVGLTVAGSMMASLVLDHFGLFGLIQQPVTILRLLGAICVCVGVVMVRWEAATAAAEKT